MNEEWWEVDSDNSDSERPLSQYWKRLCKIKPPFKSDRQYYLWLFYNSEAKEFSLEFETCFYDKNMFDKVPEDIRKIVSEHMENPFFEIDKRRFVAERTWTLIPESV